MITRLTLTDFLAHGHTVLEFGPGLTVLTGPNNTGKSAVVEALRCLSQNPTPKHFIRHGAKQARVEAELDDGTRVAWVRTKSYALYELTRPGQETQTYAKFGRKPPEDVRAVLRLDPVELETDEPMDVHIGNQRDPIFLLNRSGFATASFLASSTESAHLLAMQRALKDRVQTARREEQELVSRQAAIRADLDRLAGLPDLGLALERAREAQGRVAALEREVPALERAATALARLTAQEGLAAERLNRLDPAPPPALWPTAPLSDRATRLTALARRGERTQARARVLAPLSPPPAVEDTRPLARLAADLKRLAAREARPRGRAAALETLAAPPAPAGTAPLARLAEGLRQAQARAAMLSRRAAGLSGLAAPPAPAPLGDLGRLCRELSGALAREQALAAELERRDQALAEAGEQLAARLAEVGRCPLCGNDLSAQTFLTRGARRG
jgi:exonuclease SbcC